MTSACGVVTEVKEDGQEAGKKADQLRAVIKGQRAATIPFDLADDNITRSFVEQVEKELDEVLEIVQRPVPVKNTGREETVSLQENLQESSQEKSQKNLQERSQESELVQNRNKKREKKAGSLGKAKEQTAAKHRRKQQDNIMNGLFIFFVKCPHKDTPFREGKFSFLHYYSTKKNRNFIFTVF